MGNDYNLLIDLSAYYKNPSFLTYNSVINDLQIASQSQKDRNLVYTLSRIKSDIFNYLLNHGNSKQQNSKEIKLDLEKEDIIKIKETINNLIIGLF